MFKPTAAGKMWQPQPKTTLLVLVLVAVSLRACTGTAEPSGKPLVTVVNFNPSTNLYDSPLDSGRPLLLDLSTPDIIYTQCNKPSRSTDVTISAFETDGKKLLQPQVSFPVKAFCNAFPEDGVTGVAGLGPNSFTLSSQAAGRQRLPNKFALCLPGDAYTPGAAIFGGGPLFSPAAITSHLTNRPQEQLDVTKLLSPEVPLRLVQSGVQPVHYVRARDGGGIAVDGKLVAVAGAGKGIDIGLSITNPYTELRDDVYYPVLDAIQKGMGPKAAGARVPPAAPFEVCYDLRLLRGNVYALPRVDFMLQGGQNWTVTGIADTAGSNGLVPVSENKSCLPFVTIKDQSKLSPAVIIGGYHMANRVVVFDEDKQTLSFTPSFFGTPPSLSCGHSA